MSVHKAYIAELITFSSSAQFVGELRHFHENCNVCCNLAIKSHILREKEMVLKRECMNKLKYL